MSKLQVSIVGASGYTGYELVKILLRHPDVHIQALAVHSEAGKPYSAFYPALKGRCDLITHSVDDLSIAENSDVLFFGMPHKTSMQVIPKYLPYGKKIIDLSADYRLTDTAVYEKAYGTPHLDESHLSDFVYGLPEAKRDQIKAAANIANPGCFPTGIQLALMPVLKAGLIRTDMIIVDSKTGISGGGKTPKPAFHFPEANDNMSAYKVGSHQHEPEIEQELSQMANALVDIVFVPHLAPMTRGIYNTIYAELVEALNPDDLQKLYETSYASEPFVRVLAKNDVPEIKHVVHTNFCDIGLKIVGKRLILMSVIDNLLKGAAGQAVQNMNIMAGFEETTGLL